jgi:phenylacetate-coenzyme A ligase PaaK-like adenylate-forming protein
MTVDIFDTTPSSFTKNALEIFRFQYEHNDTYREYCDLLKVDASKVLALAQIPFLPIRLYKNRNVTTGIFEPQAIFESSRTTGSQSSKHFVKDLSIYENSFEHAFKQFYGNVEDYSILGLLPSYLERGNSSLVYMVDKLIRTSMHKSSGFFLHNHEQLAKIIQENESNQQRTLLIGVSYALLDFAEAFPMKLEHTIVMETGGMKGRKKEISKKEMHDILKTRFELKQIHSEYGMTELLTQAYSKADGIFETPAWMKIMLREEDNPLKTLENEASAVSGGINIIDLANLYSCSFIATEDMGRLHPNGSFEIHGRLENSDIRGCGLMVL